MLLKDFCIWGRLTRARGPFRAQGSALTRNVERLHGSKNLLQRGILYRHEKILLRQEDCRPKPKGLEDVIVLQWIATGPLGKSI